MHATALFAALGLAASAQAAITITGPSTSNYWVANSSNKITWTYANGDPTPVSIIVTNPDSTLLYGPFSIAEFVSTSDQSFTVTNVTLKAGSPYVVTFVNSTNPTQVYATGQNFEVKPAGTAPAPTASSGSGSGGAGGSGSGGTGSGASQTGSGTGTAAHPSSTSNASSASFATPGLGVTSALLGLVTVATAALAF
ncbi:hypothetical protein BOTBODRAFT_66118 [Botryobasidium botryosum FD-172 SS1]|uniref:Yeast cell wall synthesis Kre9/Knh1-like N-terminal domain-containing protein n=1 Tax=Botryobasidium botryosum (strain FD-172 SS1) TaxID=930990 RepID=A0A067MIG6_BOTB1|nr:hypothetical protein BOTBODRAFT_66118 [Botryobasidium botryosum FD-172 SS1]